MPLTTDDVLALCAAAWDKPFRLSVTATTVPIPSPAQQLAARAELAALPPEEKFLQDNEYPQAAPLGEYNAYRTRWHAERRRREKIEWGLRSIAYPLMFVIEKKSDVFGFDGTRTVAFREPARSWEEALAQVGIAVPAGNL